MYERLCKTVYQRKPDHIILYVGANNLSSEENAEKIAKSIIDLAKNSIKEHCTVSISSTVPRNDEWNNNPACIYLFKDNTRNNRATCEICSKLTLKTPERRQWRRSGVFAVNFEQIPHIVLVFLLLTLNK